VSSTRRSGPHRYSSNLPTHHSPGEDARSHLHGSIARAHRGRGKDHAADVGGPGQNRTATAEGEGFTDPWAHHLPNRPTRLTSRRASPRRERRLVCQFRSDCACLQEAPSQGSHPPRIHRPLDAARQHIGADEHDRGGSELVGEGGGDEGTRTPDPRDANAVLSQLSYIPTRIPGSRCVPGTAAESTTRFLPASVCVKSSPGGIGAGRRLIHSNICSILGPWPYHPPT
jgi:hypothetical protein